MYKTLDTKGRSQYPSNWKVISREINTMFKETNTAYLQSDFITMSFYTMPLETHPEKFPLLTNNSKTTQSRYIAMFLRDKGWIRHSLHAFMNPKIAQNKGEKVNG